MLQDLNDIQIWETWVWYLICHKERPPMYLKDCPSSHMTLLGSSLQTSVSYLMSDLNINQAPHSRMFKSMGALLWGLFLSQKRPSHQSTQVASSWIPLPFALEFLSSHPVSLPLQFPDVLNSKMPSGVAIVTKADLAI